jgi:hypothetical protein
VPFSSTIVQFNYLGAAIAWSRRFLSGTSKVAPVETPGSLTVGQDLFYGHPKVLNRCLLF